MKQTKIAKGECRDKRKFYFDLTMPNLSYFRTFTKITNQLSVI